MDADIEIEGAVSRQGCNWASCLTDSGRHLHRGMAASAPGELRSSRPLGDLRLWRRAAVGMTLA